MSFLLCCTGVLAQAAGPASLYRMTRIVPLGPGERWDLLTYDPASARIYVAHGDHVTVVDERTGKAVGQIGTFAGGTHGVAISTATKRGYTDDGKAGVAIAFDTRTFKALKRIAAAPDADAIVAEPMTGHIFVINGDSGSLTVIDPITDTAITTITIGAPLEIGAADGKGSLYVNGVETHEIIKIDARTNKIVARWPMPQCQRPHGLAVDGERRRVFSTCANKILVVVDADTGANIATFPIGNGSDSAAFDPVRKRVFSSNGDGTLNVFEETDEGRNLSPLATIPTMLGARTMTIDPKTGRLFLMAADLAKSQPPKIAGASPRLTFVPGSAKLLYLDPNP
jgi:YVTN family beta-propeller protein